ncbi:MAG: hypothetical protein ACRD21_22230, partial [Vicinamibacteria bacterium]
VLFEDRSQTIQLSVRSHSGAARELVRISLEDPSGTVLAKVEENVSADERSVVEIDASKAPPGRLRLRLQALDAPSGSIGFEYPAYEIVKMPASARSSLATYVDTDNVLVVDGKRRFVLGIYDTSGRSKKQSFYAKRISKIAEAKFNFYINYWLGGASADEIEALTTALRRFDMSYLHTVNMWYEKNAYWPKQTACDGTMSGTHGQTAFTLCMARELGDLPGFAGWYTADERDADEAAPVFEQYRLLRQADPDGIAFIAQNRPGEIGRWRDAADVFGVDPYPIFNIPEGKLSPFHTVTRWVETANERVESSRPVWGVIQFFQHGAKGHWPTYDELRTMSYMAVISGAKGLLYWSYGARGLAWVKDPEAKKTYWERLVRVVEEFHELEPVLLTPDAPGVVESVSGAGIRFLAKELDGTRYIFAVNNTRSPIEAEFRLSQGASQATVLKEERTLAISERKLADSFGPYAVHVYRIGE